MQFLVMIMRNLMKFISENRVIEYLKDFKPFTFSTTKANMEAAEKRKLTDVGESEKDQNKLKHIKTSTGKIVSNLTHGKGRLVPRAVLNKLEAEDFKLLEEIKTSCTDLEKIEAAIKLRIKHRLSVRLPEDFDDSSYYIEGGLRRVYPYQYLYQSYAKRRWIGRKLKDVLKEEFRDITDEQLKWRYDMQRIMVNGLPIKFDYVLRDNDFVANRNHRHELPVLAAPIKIIFEDKDMLVVDKPPSVPIHPCGRYRHNSILNILRKENGYEDVKVVHRLDRLVSGVLIFAKSSGRANILESAIKDRKVAKEYVCRVAGEFPLGKPEDDGEITVDQPLEVIPGKIGFTVVLPEGKSSLTKFKRLNFNGKTSAVLCKPQSGRMHQIRVHLQYLGHPIVNDTLYNCSAFGPERGKGGRYGKSVQQLRTDIVSLHRASTWLISEDSDVIGPGDDLKEEEDQSNNSKIVEFVSDDERKETTAALAHFFSEKSREDLEERWKLDPNKMVEDPTCRDCKSKFHDPPLRNLFLYLHALKYSGEGWCYESELPVWAKDTWQY